MAGAGTRPRRVSRVPDQVAVVSIEHDDQDRVIGARVMRVEELPLIPLAHLRY